MANNNKFFIGGKWIDASDCPDLQVINPATGVCVGSVSLGSAEHVDMAVKAAVAAFGDYSRTSRQERLQLLDRIIAAYARRQDDLAQAISEEMGAPLWLAQTAQVGLGLAHFQSALKALESFKFEEQAGRSRIVREPVGVCGFITPWNWPMNQIACKVAPALAVGCTMILKPSEMTPSCGTIFAEILEEAGVPAGVFNLVHGDGPGVGTALSAHPGVDMVSFTGSTRAGVEVARAAAPTVKRVHQELGGKSPYIVLPSADLGAAIENCLGTTFVNTGQSCNAPTRLLVPADRADEAKRLAARIAARFGPDQPDTPMGPVVSERQWTRIQSLMEEAMAEGSELVAGGPGRPEGHESGYYVRPTVFYCADNAMKIAQEEVFGPVVAMVPYRSEEEAIRIANDTPYGLAAYVSGDNAAAEKIATQLRAGQVMLNGATLDIEAPFGGYKQSGNGREWGVHAFPDFLELKAITLTA